MLAEIAVGLALVGVEFMGDFQLFQQVDSGGHQSSSSLGKVKQSAPRRVGMQDSEASVAMQTTLPYGYSKDPLTNAQLGCANQIYSTSILARMDNSFHIITCISESM